MDHLHWLRGHAIDVTLRIAFAGTVAACGAGSLATTAPITPSSDPASTTGGVVLALTETFTSPLNGFTIKHQVTFEGRVATEELVGAAVPLIDGPTVDRLSSRSGAVVVVASARLEPAATLQDWTAATALAFCGAKSSDESITLDGEPATLSTFGSCAGLFHQWVTSVRDDRGYHVIWANQRGSEAADRALFLDMLETFKFGPAASPSAGPSAAVGLRPIEDGQPVPDALLGAWYHASGAFLWILRAGDPACLDLPRTAQDCAIWLWPKGRRPEAGILTVVDGRLSLQWTQGGCTRTSVYRFGIPTERLTLTLVAGCETGDFALTRAGTGTAPIAQPPPAP